MRQIKPMRRRSLDAFVRDSVLKPKEGTVACCTRQSHLGEVCSPAPASSRTGQSSLSGPGAMLVESWWRYQRSSYGRFMANERNGLTPKAEDILSSQVSRCAHMLSVTPRRQVNGRSQRLHRNYRCEIARIVSASARTPSPPTLPV